MLKPKEAQASEMTHADVREEFKELGWETHGWSSRQL